MISNHLLHVFAFNALTLKSTSTSPVFTQQNTFERKKNYTQEMLMGQIIEFELRVPKPLVVHVLLKLVIFMTQEKSPEQVID